MQKFKTEVKTSFMIIVNPQPTSRIQALFLIILSATVAATFVLYFILKGYLPNPSPDLSLLIDAYRNAVAPEPIERFIFISLGLVVPLFCLYLTRNHGLFHEKNFHTLAAISLPLTTSLILFLPLFGSDFLEWVAGRSLLVEDKNSIRTLPISTNSLLCIFLALSTLWCFLNIHNKLPKFKPKTLRIGALIFSSGFLLLLIMVWRIVSLHSVGTTAEWTLHLEAAIYAISQVIAGKTLLVDLPSQYGLYPEIIAPLFRIIPPTLLNYSLLFATLQFISMLGLFFVLTKSVRSPTLLLLGCLSLLMITFDTCLHYAGSQDRYFQYWPIRFFWPAISVFVFYGYIRHKTFFNCMVLSIVGALGTLWVIDTGVFIPLAFASYLLVKAIIQSDKRSNFLLSLGLHGIVTLLVFIFFLSYLSFKANQPILLSWLFLYQKVFYTLGFSMLPLPYSLHPWMAVLGIYLLALLTAFSEWYQGKESLRADFYFYLSVLGLGLFTYYQGRSHVFNLIKVCWPAFIIITIGADHILYQIKQRYLAITTICFPITATAFLLFVSAQLLSNLPQMSRELKANFLTYKTIYWPFIASEIAFIKAHSHPKQECLILAQRQGTYHFESGLASPIKGPGFAEMLLKSHLDEFESQVLGGQIKCIFLGIGKASVPSIPLSTSKLTMLYTTVASNQENTLLYLTPKTAER